jgi:hypothetical protein
LSIFTTPQWAATIRAARSSEPYQVKEVSLSDFLDFKGFSNQLKNFTISTDNEKVDWHGMKILKFISD